MSAPRLSGGSSRGGSCRYRISVCSACRRRRLPCADGEARRGTSKRTRRAKDPRRSRRGTSDCGPARTRKRHRTRGPPRTSAPTTAPHGNPADTAHGRVALVATEAARVRCAPGTGGSRLSRPRRRGSIARRAREGRACRDRGGAARTRKRHRTHGPPRTSAPTTAPHGNPADTAHGRVALVATEGGAGPLRAGPAVARERDPPAPLLHERGTVRVARAAEPARTPPAVGPG